MKKLEQLTFFYLLVALFIPNQEQSPVLCFKNNLVEKTKVKDNVGSRVNVKYKKGGLSDPYLEQINGPLPLERKK